MSERDGEGTEKKELFGCADVVKWFGRKLVLDGARFLVPVSYTHLLPEYSKNGPFP